MGLSVKAGSFTKSTAAATASQSVTGLGFTPKCLILWSVGGLTSGTWVAHVMQTYGFTSGASNSYSICAAEQNATSLATCRVRIAAKALTFLQYDGTLLAECDLSSLDADGFTLSWTTNNASAYILHYLALGGSDLTGAKAISWATGTSSSNLSITGVGFKPTAVLQAGIGNATAIPTTSSGLVAMFGGMDGNGNQWSDSMMSGFFSAPTIEETLQRTNMVLQQTNTSAHSGLSPNHEFDYVSLDSDGFTVKPVTNYSSSSDMIALCLGGVKANIGNFSKSTGAAPASQSVTGVGFKPSALLLMSNQQTASTTSLAGLRHGIAATDGTNVEASAIQGKDNTSSTLDHALSKTSKAFVKANNDSQTVDAEADFTSFDNDGFTLSWSTNDAVATQLLYLALGPTSPTAHPRSFACIY